MENLPARHEYSPFESFEERVRYFAHWTLILYQRGGEYGRENIARMEDQLGY